MIFRLNMNYIKMNVIKEYKTTQWNIQCGVT